MSLPFPQSLCHACAGNRYVRPGRGGVYLLCTRRPEKYLGQPVLRCPAFEPALEEPMPAAKRTAPAAERNKAPILAALAPRLPAAARVLEVASGTGQHTAHFAAALPGLHFQPTDADPENLPGIQAWTADLPNVAPPRVLDAVTGPWLAADVVYCANMIHIAPWAAAEGLFRGAAGCLTPGGILFLYGPFRFHGEFLAASNAAFDESLRARDPRWGVRDVDALDALGAAVGLERIDTVALPANNHLLIWTRSAA